MDKRDGTGWKQFERTELSLWTIGCYIPVFWSSTPWKTWQRSCIPVHFGRRRGPNERNNHACRCARYQEEGFDHCSYWRRQGQDDGRSGCCAARLRVWNESADAAILQRQVEVRGIAKRAEAGKLGDFSDGQGIHLGEQGY